MLTAYPGVMHDVLAAGAKWAEANETYSNAVTDGNLVTAPAWAARPAGIKSHSSCFLFHEQPIPT